eukprot:3480851-Amphidinium_carterae.1
MDAKGQTQPLHPICIPMADLAMASRQLYFLVGHHDDTKRNGGATWLRNMQPCPVFHVGIS